MCIRYDNDSILSSFVDMCICAVRKTKAKPRLGGEGKWEFEIGEEYGRLPSVYREPEGMVESGSNVSQGCSTGLGGVGLVNCAMNRCHLVV